MKKVDEFIKTVDARIEQHGENIFFDFFKKYFVYFSSMVLLSVFGIFVYQILRERPLFLATVITSDLVQIERHLNEIDRDCNILSILPERANVGKFAGSTIGSLNLAYPEKWQGPYMRRNPTIHGIFYELVRTREGVYIVPGRGVTLPNGLVVGKDFEITFATEVNTMLQPGGQLSYKNEPLAKMLQFKIGDWDSPMFQHSTYDKVRKALQEFNDALPFAHADVPAKASVTLT